MLPPGVRFTGRGRAGRNRLEGRWGRTEVVGRADRQPNEGSWGPFMRNPGVAPVSFTPTSRQDRAKERCLHLFSFRLEHQPLVEDRI